MSIMKAIRLRTAHLVDPIGIDVKTPMLSWNVMGGTKQTAYQIIAVCDDGKIWDTGKVYSNSMHIVYGGTACSRLRVSWKICVWDENDVPGEWSRSAYFEYAFLEKNDWKAKWINPEIELFKETENQPASVLVRHFELESVKNARIYSSCHGVYALYINGIRVKENILTPGTSEYWYRMPYQTFDVSDYLICGDNKIEAVLGDGWYRGCNGNTGTRNVFGTDIALLLQLEVDKKIVLISDENWKASQEGMIRFNDIQLGEKVDARMNPKNFHDVKIEDHSLNNLMCMNSLPICEKECFSAKLICTPNGEQVLDFGQNMSGYVAFKINAKSGQTLKLTHGESLDEDGNFTDENIDTIGRKMPLHQVIEYTCKDGLNEYTPTMCIFGFRYAKVETDIPITGDEFTAHAVYSDMATTATFNCDNVLVNKFFKNVIWSQKSNFVDIPTDCPQRERSGWTGDAAIFVDAGLMLMDSYPVFSKWLGECRVNQYEDGRIPNINPRRQKSPNIFDKMYDASCAWGSACVIVPYAMYQNSGDRSILKDNYAMMKRWLDFCEKKAKKSRLQNLFSRNPYKNYIIDTGIHYGEWLEVGIPMEQSMKEIIFHGAPDIDTAYFAYICRLMTYIAKILDMPDDVCYYEKLYEKTNKAYHSIELPDGEIHSDHQCRYVRPLQLGLLSEDESKRAALALNELVKNCGYHLNTGFLTTGSLCKVLGEYGYVDTAYRVLLQEDSPGWLYAVKNGATTIWESWEGLRGSAGVSSLNHYSKGAVASWMIKGIGGISVEDRLIKIKPQVSKLLKFAEVSFESNVGTIKSKWEHIDGYIEYTIEIPSNTEGVFILRNDTQKELSVGINKFIINIDEAIL